MPLAVTLPPVKTFADILAELRPRVKLNATLGNTPALESILTEANDYVFEQLDNGLPWQSVLTLQPNVALYPFTADSGLPIARGSVQAVWIEQGSSIRVPLPQGIQHFQRADTTLRTIPQRYDTTLTNAAQTGAFTLEVWPTPDQAYPLYIDHNRVLTRFSQPADVPCVPYRLLFGYALALAKAHYGQADAETAGQSFKTLLANEKSKQRENRRFIPPTSERRGPQVVKTAGGYRQV